ncbi:MAG TPA: hypothetical protein VGD63_10435 [Steroidobacteraceae bacterium]
MLFSTANTGAPATESNAGCTFDGKAIGAGTPWSQRTIEERQDAPNDYEAPANQAPNGVPSRSQEHLVRADIGIGIQRRVLRREIKFVGVRMDPINVAFRSGEDLVRTRSGNIFSDAHVGV